MSLYLLDAASRLALADSLGEDPQTVMALHLLRRDLCDVYLMGRPPSFDAAIIQSHDLPGEPLAFGSDPAAIWTVLHDLPGWVCINVIPAVAPNLRDLIEREMGMPVRTLDDIYSVLRKPVRSFGDTQVRLLDRSDLRLLETAPLELGIGGFGSPECLLNEGLVACAVVEGQIVAEAHSSARTIHYAEIGVATLENWRGRELATAAASLVARAIQQSGQIPVWSAGSHNAPSLRIARKLGFEEVSRRVYLIPSREADP